MTWNCVFISMVIGKRFLQIDGMSQSDIITVFTKSSPINGILLVQFWDNKQIFIMTLIRPLALIAVLKCEVQCFLTTFSQSVAVPFMCIFHPHRMFPLHNIPHLKRTEKALQNIFCLWWPKRSFRKITDPHTDGACDVVNKHLINFHVFNRMLLVFSSCFTHFIGILHFYTEI